MLRVMARDENYRSNMEYRALILFGAWSTPVLSSTIVAARTIPEAKYRRSGSSASPQVWPPKLLLELPEVQTLRLWLETEPAARIR